MTTILSSYIGDYSQTIRINDYKDNEIIVKKANKVLYDGIATHIIEDGRVLKFKDDKGKQHEYVKYPTYTTI